MPKNNSLTRSDMITLIANKTGVTKGDVDRVLDAFFALIIAELSKNNDVRLSGFGVFHNVKYKRRKVKDNVGRQGENCEVGERWIPKFKVSALVREKVNRKVSSL